MKNSKVLFAFTLFFLSICCYGQVTVDPTFLDFWVGTWDASWSNPDGSTGKGINRITKILDGKIIQENFEDASSGGLKGISISVYNSKTKTWHQAWADNQDGYFDLEGGIENGKKFFRTKTYEQNGKKIFHRMVYYDITPASFTWDWERTTDGGKTWSLQWRMNYTKTQGN